MPNYHPLDKLITDDSLFLLEAMVPFVDYHYKKYLILYIKYKELMSIFQALNNRSYLSECGFDCHPHSQEEFLTDLCGFLPVDITSQIKQMKQMMSMMSMMDAMKETKDDTPTKEAEKDDCNEDTSLYDSIISILNETTDL